MDLREMSYIVELAKYKSISEAARILFIPQPTLSNALKRVEKEVGQTLFKRTASGMEITACGRKFVELALKSIEMRNKIYDEMKRAKENDRKVRLGVSNGWGEYLVPKILPELKSVFTEITLDIVLGNSIYILEMIKDGRLDYAIVPQSEEIAGLDSEVLFEDQVILATPPNSAEKGAQELEGEGLALFPITALKEKEFILPEKGHVRDFVEHYFKKNNIPYNVTITCPSLMITKSLVSQGLGYGFVSRSFATRTSPGDPQYFLIEEMTAKMSLILIKNEKRIFKGISFADELKKIIKDIQRVEFS